jgi:hypothetical protein
LQGLKEYTMHIVSSGRYLVPALLGGLLATSVASAAELREGQATVTQLAPNASAVTYFVDRPDGYHVIVTVRTGQDDGAGALHQPAAVRFTSRIVPGQTIDLAMPEVSEGKVIEITRRAGRVAVETRRAEALQD